jgi:hypothetical protein
MILTDGRQIDVAWLAERKQKQGISGNGSYIRQQNSLHSLQYYESQLQYRELVFILIVAFLLH